MRIIKYIFLLILLAVIAVSVYVATQKGDFEVSRSVIIDVPKPVVFNYVNDYKNWEDWASWKEDNPNLNFTYAENTVGNGASYSWSGATESGKMTSIFVKPNDSISQKVVYSGNEATASITFKDTLGKTKVTWRSKGSVAFMAKISATFSGGVNAMMEEMQERSLNNLNKVITREMNTFEVKVNGISQKNGTFYIKQSTTCRNADLQSRLLTMLPKLINFFKKNNIPMNGSPFVRYENIDSANNTVTFSVCIPLREEVFIADQSDISLGFLDSFSALKVTLTGDYSHRSEARKKAAEYLQTNHIEENTAIPKLDVYVKSASDIRYPSKWVTEILIPVRTAAAPLVATPAVVPPTATVNPTPSVPAQ
ncbi:SRPBCC family protein [Flavobacterium sp. 3HN19-14]|uniref:SRPBCC family protein n=1 Tax=Flavobacterium sp. 3HN19-14 TaxID=3448133 RepID=UPI003EE34087